MSSSGPSADDHHHAAETGGSERVSSHLRAQGHPAHPASSSSSLSGPSHSSNLAISSALDDPLLSPSRRGDRGATPLARSSPPLSPILLQQHHQPPPLQQPASITFQDTPAPPLEDMSRNYNTISTPGGSTGAAPLRNVYDESEAVPSRTASPAVPAEDSVGNSDSGPRRPGILQTDSSNSRQGLGLAAARNRTASVASTGANPRSISFKRRGPGGPRNVSNTNSRRPSTAGDSGTPLSGFIHRASFGALGRPRTQTDALGQDGNPRKSFAAVSQASADAVSRWRNMRRVHTLSVHPPISGDPEDPSSWSFPEAKPQIPTLLPNPEAPPANPLPWLPFIVLCLVCFGEFSSAGVAGPFLFFMIEEFNVGGESDVGFWAGIVSSVFFFAQFLTSLLWASIADKYGRRAVLLASLCGNAITLATFGASTNLKMAITVRLAQGLFNGAVGVAKGAIRDLTDSTNEGRAYAILGFAWGFGGILGPILGGVLEHPVDKFPFLFGNVELFKQYPYLLPCLAGASFTTLGAFLSLFIGPDGGPREGRIKLEAGADGDDVDAEDVGGQAAPSSRNPFAASTQDNSSNPGGSLTRSAGKRISGYFTQDGGAANERGLAPGPHSADSDSTARPTDDARTHAAGASSISMGPTHTTGGGLPRTFTQQVDEETGGPPSPIDSDDEGTIVTRSNTGRRGSHTAARGPQGWRFSRTEERRRGILGGGSAYGYEPSAARRGSRSSHLSGPQEAASARGSGFAVRNRHLGFGAFGPAGSANNSHINANRLSLANSAMGSAFDYAPDFEAVGQDPNLAPQPRRLNFAQRFLLANDDAVSSITDLWVAAAINGDEAYSALDEDGYYEDEDGFDEEDDEDDAGNDSQVIDEDSSFNDGDSTAGLDDENDAGAGRTSGLTDPRVPGSSAISASARRPYLPPLNFAQRRSGRAASNFSRPRSMRLGSFAQARMPSLYSNTGIDLPSPWNEMPPNADALTGPDGATVPAPAAAVSGGQGKQGGYDPTLAGIPESASARNTVGREQGAQLAAGERQRLLQGHEQAAVAPPEKAPAQPSLFALLPMTIIAHYGLMAFHSATVDQVFMAFLVTPYSSGGLGLTAAHYAELISAMAFCQIGFQFYFYPKIGPPQGKRSHLAMMRLGTILHPLAYLCFPLLRNFLHPSTDAVVMTFMIIFASLRWLANICAFTAVSILMNALTPPNLVPLANGLAQTTSSAARFIGPIIGGVVWAKGIEGGVDNHAWPFNYHLGFEFVALAAFCGFLHATFVLKSSA